MAHLSPPELLQNDIFCGTSLDLHKLIAKMVTNGTVELSETLALWSKETVVLGHLEKLIKECLSLRPV
jgi:hypothetical protein